MKQLAHPFLRFAYRTYVGWLRLKGQPLRSVAVAVWHNGKVLKVRHSYRPGWSLPGGAVQQGEDPRFAACREVREEVGLSLQPNDLTLLTKSQRGSCQYHVYEYRLGERPQIKIDNWEIVEARFLDRP